MRLARALLVAVIALLPPAAAVAADAVEVDFGAMVEGVYDSNVFRTRSDPKQDGSFRFTPTIEIGVPGRKLSGTLYYAPTYEVFTTYSDANDFTHDLRNTIEWLPQETTTINLDNRFQAVDVLNYADPEAIGGETEPVPDNDINRERLHIFGSALRITHAISPRWTSDTSVDFHLFNAERASTVDSRSIAAFQSFDYGLTASDRIGGGIGATVQFFDDTRLLPKSNSYVYQFFANYTRNFGERTTLTLRVGPALIHTVQDDFDASQTFGETRLSHPFTSTLDENGDPITQVGQIDYDVMDVNGSTLPGSTPIAAGSVLVPTAGTCLAANNQSTLYDPNANRCRNDTLLRNDAAYPNEQAEIAGILTDSVTITGSNSGVNDLRWTVFGEAALTHYWLPTLASTLSYNRSESTPNGQGANTVADSVAFRTNWQPSELWDLSLLASYVRRETPTDLASSLLVIQADDSPTGFELVEFNGDSRRVDVSNAVATHRWGVTLRAARRITRRISASFRFGYSDQQSQHTSRNPNDFEHFLAMVGVKYDFDRIRF